jgi:tripartite-type tricarboxylate transporter receptor subunit TctC
MTQRTIRRSLFALGVAAAALSAWPGSPTAQDGYPIRPIKLVVPLAAGGGIDFTARVTAQKLSDLLGQQVVVENQGGAGGTPASIPWYERRRTATRCFIIPLPGW